MPRTHHPYPPEFKRQIVELARLGRSAAELAREFEPTPAHRHTGAGSMKPSVNGSNKRIAMKAAVPTD